MAISPDGHHIVFGAIRNGTYQLHLRTLDEAEAKPMPGTEGFSYATAPFFSPDGKWVGYNSDGKLKKIPLEGGPAIDLVEIESHAYPGVTWGPNDTIVFGRMEGGLMQVSAAGEGTPEPLTTLDVDRGELSHRLPSFLPDGKGVLFTIRRNSRWDEAEIAVLSLATGRYEVLAENGADPRYVSTGHLVYAQLGTLMAAPFDLERQEVTGPSVPVLSNIRQAVNTRIFDTGYTQYSVSESGSLVYISGGIFPDGKRTPVWVDRRGVEEPVPIPPRAYGQPRLSPDGRRLAFNTWGMVAVPLREPEVDRDVWVHDIERGGLTRLTFEGSNGRPVWTPDGTQVVFGSDRGGGPMNLYVKSAGGTGQARRLMTSPQNQVAGDFSPDGRELVFLQGGDMWVLRFDGDHEPRPLLETPFGEGRPAFSPDGRWLAYTSDEYDHRNAVYVIPYPDAGKRYQISNGIGREPVWSGNGRELYYHRPKEWTSENELQEVFAVDIQTEPEFRAGLPRKLFEGRYPGGSWDVTSDGQHFVMMRKDESPMVEATEFHLILNWFEELKRLVPTGN